MLETDTGDTGCVAAFEVISYGEWACHLGQCPTQYMVGLILSRRILSSPSPDRAPLFRRATRKTCLRELSWTPRAVEAAHARLAPFVATP